MDPILISSMYSLREWIPPEEIVDHDDIMCNKHICIYPYILKQLQEANESDCYYHINRIFNEYFYFIDMYYPDIDYSDIFLKYFHCLDIYVLEKFAQYNKNQRIIDAIIDHIQTEEYGLSEEDIDEDLIYCLNQNKLAFPFLIKNQKYIKFNFFKYVDDLNMLRLINVDNYHWKSLCMNDNESIVDTIISINKVKVDVYYQLSYFCNNKNPRIVKFVEETIENDFSKFINRIYILFENKLYIPFIIKHIHKIDFTKIEEYYITLLVCEEFIDYLYLIVDYIDFNKVGYIKSSKAMDFLNKYLDRFTAYPILAENEYSINILRANKNKLDEDFWNDLCINAKTKEQFDFIEENIFLLIKENCILSLCKNIYKPDRALNIIKKYLYNIPDRYSSLTYLSCSPDELNLLKKYQGLTICDYIVYNKDIFTIKQDVIFKYKLYTFQIEEYSKEYPVDYIKLKRCIRMFRRAYENPRYVMCYNRLSKECNQFNQLNKLNKLN